MPETSVMFDAQLRRAVGLHQAGRLTEAELIYRQILALKPDLAEVHLNCALAQCGQGKHCDAEHSLRQALAIQPTLIKAHSLLGDVLSLQKRYRDATNAYQNAIKLKPDHFEAHNNLGNVLILLGETKRAAAAYRGAIRIKPDFAQAYNNLGLANLEMGFFEEARAAFRHAVVLAPGYAEAHCGLGNALRKLNCTQEAEQEFQTAVGLAPNHANAHLNLSSYYFDAGRLADAESAAQEAVRLSPSIPECHNALGNALRGLGKLTEAEREYRSAIQIAPDYAEGHKHLAMLLEEMGTLDEAFSLFKHYAAMKFGSATSRTETPHKLRHDEEQRTWRGAEVGAFHLGDGDRIAGAAVNPTNRVADINAMWETSQPQLVVIDDLLTNEALEKLRRFCLESTVWHKAYDSGYLGAFPEHGFAPPLLAQIAEELRATYPAIIEDYPLLHFWAFKYDSNLRGIKKHADFAAVNVNFWITPEDANLDPEHGGLVVWDVAAPFDWNFAKYNAAEEDICSFLETQQAKPITVPYRTNRAVIFDSDLFHETDTIRFKAGYVNRRINVTLLFGRRQIQKK